MRPEARKFIGPLLPKQQSRRHQAIRRMNHIKSFAYAYNVPIGYVFINWLEFKMKASEAGIYDL